ncbi:SCO6745 family protein [Haloechinothrix salitolerans]|uniref:SalK n=1 Tax=Haloechinothrix salitolerans TaxID=926830 RepID=A0ABW2BYI3_9PSEU
MSDTVELGMVRQLWRLLEPVHAVLYYAPEAFAEAEALGYATDERWPSYFAWRAAPLGDASAELVTSTFYSFRPRMVARYVPAAWDVASADKVLAARMRAVDRALRTILGDRIDSRELAEAAELARHAATSANTAGRPLAAANAALSWPDAPHLVLWQAATVLREHRGDGHIAALQAHQLDPCESLVSFAAVGAAEKDVFASREWSDVEWHAAADRLAERGWLGPDGTATSVGIDGREDVERLTDELAAPPWRELGAARAGRLAELAMPITMAIVSAGILPRRSTLGLGR